MNLLAFAFADLAWWSWLIVALPLWAAAKIGLAGPLLRGRAHWPAIIGVAGALAMSIGLLVAMPKGHPAAAHEVVSPPESAADIAYFDWVPTTLHPTADPADSADSAVITARFLVDPLTIVMLLTVTLVSLLVVIYSRDYMRDHHGQPERGYERFFAFMALFVAGMCLLVLAGNFLLLYVGWELVGLCSYLLIGFYYPRPSAADAAKKAFIVNRIGDCGFALGVLAIYLVFGRLDYHGVFAAAQAAFSGDSAALQAVLHLPAPASAALLASRIQLWMTPICLLLFAGAVGKSAQIPLYVWLPDAMEGPTPVSALIHAATMVTAGVYMVARCGPLFANSPFALDVIAAIGCVTALFAATIALVQNDMKRILAYSTISQLGYMFLALGVCAADAAVFHLFTHAFFKALLFLAAGSVMHALNGTIDIRRFSGLRKVLPITAWTFILGGLALAGFPLLSGFWSKDEILAAAISSHPLLGWLGILTALLTAFYTFRMIFIAFFGPYRADAHHPRESGPWMTVPLILLAAGAVFAGYLGVTFAGPHPFLGLFSPGGRFQAFLAGPLQAWHDASLAEGLSLGHSALLPYLAAGLAILGILAAWFVYLQRPALAPTLQRRLGPLYQLLSRKYFIDELYNLVIVGASWTIGQILYFFDRYVIDGLVFTVTLIPRTIGFVTRAGQLGAVQGYALLMVGFSVVVVLVVLLTA